MGKMKCELSDAEINHLRKLLSWVNCEVGQTPEEMAETIRSIAPIVGRDASSEGVQRLRESYDRSKAVPKYVRAAIKALKKTIAHHVGEIVDVEPGREVQGIGSNDSRAA